MGAIVLLYIPASRARGSFLSDAVYLLRVHVGSDRVRCPACGTWSRSELRIRDEPVTYYISPFPPSVIASQTRRAWGTFSYPRTARAASDKLHNSALPDAVCLTVALSTIFRATCTFIWRCLTLPVSTSEACTYLMTKELNAISAL